MPSNLEIKTPLFSLEEVRKKIRLLPAAYSGTLHQRDTYFNIPQGRLKLREMPDRDHELIVYARPDQRERISDYHVCRCGDSAQLRLVLEQALGIRFVVEKKRELWMFGGTRIHLDEVMDLGFFMEFEIPIGEFKPGEAERTLQFLIRELSLDPAVFIGGSYIDLMLEKDAKSFSSV